MTATARTTSTAVATQERPSVLLEKARERIEPYLPPGLRFDSIISDVFIATRKNPDLLKCDPESLVLAVCEVQQRGLRIGVTCHLVPKGGKVVAWNDYRGDIEMIVRSGAAREVDARVVYEGETFEYEEGIGTPHLRHTIEQDVTKRGKLKGAYAIFYTTRTRARVRWMPAEDIDAIRQKHSLQWKSGPLQPWYALKTVIRQGAKLLPKNAALASVFASFDRDEDEAAPAIPALAAVPLLRADEYEDQGMIGAGDEGDPGPEFQDDRALADQDTDQPSLGLAPAPARRAPTAQSQGR